MPMDAAHAREVFERLTRSRCLDALADAVTPTAAPVAPRLGRTTAADAAAVEARWEALEAARGDAMPAERATLHTDQPEVLGPRHAENLIGRVEVPLGVAGPLRVCGTAAAGDYFVPMATCEAALIASCTRGAHAIGRAGGCAAAVLSEGVVRAPAFLFASLAEAGRFLHWLTGELPAVTAAAEGTSHHAKLTGVTFTLEGCHAYLRLTYRTGEASGQNMVTLATEAACRWIVANTPVTPAAWYVEANFSGDKKATAQAFAGVRGRKVVAEVELPGRVVRRFLRTTPAAMDRYLRVSTIGGVLGGSIGVQGHYANALAALYLATGQDVACVAESAIGVTRMERRGAEGGDDERLYASVTLPAVMVGTVGGGTSLPTAAACLSILGLGDGKPGSAGALAEIAGALCLAGELSIIAALSAGHFSEAHRTLARGSDA